MKAAAPVLATLISILSGCVSDLGYLAKQGNYLLRYSNGTESVDDLLKAASTPPDVRGFLQEVKEIRRFAVESIGLRDNGNYTRYKSIEKDYLVEVVQACDAASFTPYQWSFPFLGRLPYKGFYEHSDAQRGGTPQERRLRRHRAQGGRLQHAGLHQGPRCIPS